MDDKNKIKQEVQKKYASVATQPASRGCCDTGQSQSSCCGGTELIQLVDYGDLDENLVEGANLGLGCGMPTTFAAIQPGETVLDLGSGAGVDVFLAAKAVGAEGRAIGVDMTPQMIARAWDNAVKGGYSNVDFRLGDIEDLPVESDSVDVVISNCVINLSPDKPRVFAEIFRVLKPGGRFSISDTVTYGNVPAEIREDLSLWAGCVAGAPDRELYLAMIAEAGFSEIKINQSVEYDYQKGPDYGLASISVEARKK